MNLPDYVSVERRRVKWVRVQIHPGGEVRIVIPHRYSMDRLVQIYRKKRHWIEGKRQHLLADPASKFGIDPEEVLLFGKGYRFEVASSDATDIDHQQRRIISDRNLQDAEQLLDWYTRLAKSYLPDRTALLADRWGMEFNRVAVRAQKTRWGSCSALGNISLNWKLVKTPVWVSDYVITHELAHTRVMNHSPLFWAQVERLLPDYREARLWVRQYGAFL